MTAEDRERIRLAVDQAVRERRGLFIAAGELQVCSGCGGDHDLYTRGCKRCSDRHSQRRQRQNPDFRARHNAARLQRHRAQKQAA